MISDHWFKDLPKLLKPHDVLVINDTAVMKARLFARKSSGAKVEILIERILEETKVIAQTKSNSKTSLFLGNIFFVHKTASAVPLVLFCKTVLA